MSASCKHRKDDGVCNGMYRGFGCIDERCAYLKGIREASEQEPCQHFLDSTYCAKLHKFHCAGQGNCESHLGISSGMRGKV